MPFDDVFPDLNAPVTVDTQEQLDRINAARRIAYGNPEEAATKTTQAAQLGESYESLRYQKSPEIAQRLAEQRINRTLMEHPEMLDWAKKDPQGADMAGDDSVLSSLAGWFNDNVRTARHGWRAGRGTAEQGIIYDNAMTEGLRDLTEEEKKRSAEIDEMTRRYGIEHEDSTLYDFTNLLGTWLGGFQHIPSKTAAESAGIGAVIGGAGSTALATGGAMLAPVTGGASLGVAVAAGMTYAGFRNAYAIEGGLKYKELLEAGLTKDEAFLYSRPVALINAGLEFVPALHAAKIAGAPAVAAIKKSMGKLAKRDAIAMRYTWGKIGLDFLKGTLVGGAEETSTEILQEANGILWEEIGKRFSSVKDLEGKSADEIAEQIWDVAKHTWRGASVMSALVRMPGAAHSIHGIREAKRNKAYLEQVALTAQGSKLHERSPSHFGSFVAHIAGTGKQTLYIDGRSFHQAVTEAGLTEEQVQAVFGDTGVQQMRHETGDSAVDVEISLQDYAAKVSGTTADPIFQPHVRTDREGYTYAQAVENEVEAAREARRARDGLGDSFRPLSQEEVAALSDRDRKTYEATAARSRVRQRIARSLTNAVERGGLDAKVFTPAQIAWNASMTTRAYEKLAGKLNIPLEDFARRFGADITWETETGVGVADRFDTPVDVQGGVGSLRQILTQARGEAVQGEASEVTQLRNALNAMPPEQRQSVEALLSAIGDAQPASALAPETQGLVDRARGGETASAMNAVQALWRAIPQGVRNQIEAALPAEMRTELGNIRNDYRTRDLIRASRMQSASVNQEESATDNNGNFDPANPNIYRQQASTALPSAASIKKGTAEDPRYVRQWADMNAAMEDDTFVQKALDKLLQNIPGAAGAAKGAETPRDAIERIVEQFKDNLLWLYNHIPSDVRDRAKLWYVGANRTASTWAVRYGLRLRQTAAIIAVFSPQTDWFTNMSRAERLLDIWFSARRSVLDEKSDGFFAQFCEVYGADYSTAKGKTLEELVNEGQMQAAAAWIRAYDKSLNSPAFNVLKPEGGSAGVYKTTKGAPRTFSYSSSSHIIKAISIIRDGRMENVYQQIGDEFKVRDFYNNIYDPNNVNASTIDTHAVGADTLNVTTSSGESSASVVDNFGLPGNAVSGQKGTYPFHFEAYRRAAAEVGIDPREMQSITWEAIRVLFPPETKTALYKPVKEIWESYDRGEITVDQAREKVFEIAGGFREIAWQGTPFDDTITQTYDRSNVQLYDDIVQPEPEPELSLEVAPDPNDKEAMERWGQLTNDEKLAITNEIVEYVIGRVSLETKTFISEPNLQRGGYHGESNHSIRVYIADDGDYIRCGRLFATYLNQDSVMAVSNKTGEGMFDCKILRIQLPEGFTSEQVDDLYENQIDKMLIDDNNQRLVEGHSTANGIMTIVAEAEKIEAIKAKLAAIDLPYAYRVNDGYAGFLEAYKDEEEAQNARDDTGRGEGVRQEASLGYDPDLRREISAMVDRAIQERLESRRAKEQAGSAQQQPGQVSPVYNQAAAFTPDQSLINAAVSNFGITNDPREAGYILPDGRMLDFSGRHWGGGDGGSRIVEHNDIGEVEGIEGGGTDAMVEFMARTGAMRVDVNAGIASSAQNPTPEQMGVLSVATRGKPLSLSLITTDGRIVADRELARSNAGSIREFFGQAQGMRDRGQVGNIYAQTAYHGSPYHYWQALGESGATNLSDRMALSLETARAMEKNGRKPIDVKIATGWERGYDGKWRYEIPDGKVKPAQSGGGIYGTLEGEHKLGNLYEAEQLYTAYPELRNLDVVIEPYSDPRTTAWFDGNAIHINSNSALLDRKFKALATALDKAARADEVLTKVNEGFTEEERDDAEERGIRLPTYSQAERAEARARREVDRINADIATQLRYAIVHEVQHWIQDREGFDSGTNAEAMAEAIRNAPEGSRLSSLSPEDAYRFSGGEGESRAMEERLRMSDEERRRTLIIDSFDVAPEDLILMEGNSEGNSGASSLPRGSFDPRNNSIRLTANANLSTFAHEMGHWYLESLGYFVSQGMADEGLVNDFNALLSSFGVGSVAEWNALPDARKEVCHERFAAWVEEYLATGDCPVPEAKPILRRFKDWIISVYKDSFLFTGSVHGALSARHKTLFGEDLPALSDEVRQVLDHALMSNEEMAQLEAQQGTPPLFAEKPEGVTDQEWQDYVERMQARTEEGREALAQKNLEKMRWAQAAHSKVLKRVQAAAAKVRKQMEEIARDRVLAPGTLWGKIDAVKRLPRDLRLSEEGLDAYLSADEIAQLKRFRIVAGKGYGIPLSDFCSNWGFDDPREFLQSAVVHREAIKLHIEAIADQLMQERYPAYASEKDILNTVADALAPEVAEAFAANEIAFIERQMAGTAEGNKIAAGRAETVGVEGETFVSLMNALRRAEGEVRQALRDGDYASAATARARRDLLREQVRKLARDSKNVAQTTRVELLDAQNAAELLLGMTPLGRISPTYYLGLAKQSASRALKAMAANDLPTALAEKRNQLVYQVMARRAMQIEKGEIRKVLNIRKSLSQSDEKLGKTRDVDLLNYLRAVLGEFGLQTPNQKESAGAYIERIRAYDPNLAAGLTQMYQRLTANAMPWQTLTYADFQAFAEQVGAVWFLARQSKQIEIDGKKKDIAKTREALANQLRKRYAGKSNAHVNSTPTTKDKVWQKVLSLDAGLRRVLSWCRDMDEGNPERPFMRYVYEPVKKGIDTYRTRQREVGKRLTAIYEQYEKARTKHEGKIVAHELMQFDEFGEVSNPDPWVFHTKSELIGALLHTGNASNKQKLVGGYRWGAVSTDENGREFVDCSGWDAFIQRMVEEGVLTKADFDFVQAMWDVMESIKPETQTAYHEITGMYFSEITNTPFTVQFPDGTSVTYKGGYAPAKVDPAQVRDHSADEEQALHAINQSYGYPTGGMNFTKNRTEQYREKLLMDIDLVASHVNEALRMAHIEKPARDVFRLFANKKFKSLFNTYGNPFAIDQMLIPWLNRAVNQTVTTAETNAGWKVVSRLLTEVKRRTGLVAMAGNLANALEEVSGFSVALTRVPGAEIRRALLAYNTGKLKAEDVMALSPHMRARLQDSELYALERAEKTFKVEASKLDRASAFCAAHGYILQQIVQRYVDVPVWWAAYEDAQKKGYSPEEAVQIADEVIDETMSSNTAEGISAIEAGTPLHRALLMFYNYFNMQFNLLHTELGRAVRLGQYGKAAWAFATVCLVPQLISDLFSRLVGSRVGKEIGGDDDDDDDWWIIRALRYFAGQTVQAGFNIAPWLGQAGNWLSDIVSGEEQRFGGQRISMTPTISSIEAAGRLPKDFERVMDGKGYRTAVRDSLQVISVITGLPLAQPFGRPLGYLADVAEGKTDDGVIDTARGLVSGKSPNRK